MPTLNDQTFTGVIFDLGHTLVASGTQSPRGFFCDLFGFEGNHDFLEAIVLNFHYDSPEDIIKALRFHEFEVTDERAKKIEDYWNFQLAAPKLLEGAEALVDSLIERDVPLGIISNIWSPYLTGAMNQLPQLFRYSRTVVASCRFGEQKPHPSLFEGAIHRMQLPPHELLMVGDTYSKDVLPALELGMYAAWYLIRPDKQVKHLANIVMGKSPAPTFAFSHLDELRAALG
ncbi:MAG: HAD family hydrolase [Planctomycetes bacterium]|nr:HAD family hydrolase [Planctomycetota bacterium]